MARPPRKKPIKPPTPRPAEADDVGGKVLVTANDFILICEDLAKHGGKYKACDNLGFTYSAVQGAIRDMVNRGDDSWQVLWDDAYEQFREGLEQEARRRAQDGVETPVFGPNGLVGHRKEFSDRLMEVMLKGHFPDRYRDRVLHSGTVGLEPVDAFANLSHRAKREIRAIIMRDLEEQRELARSREAVAVTQTAAGALDDMRNEEDRDA